MNTRRPDPMARGTRGIALLPAVGSFAASVPAIGRTTAG